MLAILARTLMRVACVPLLQQSGFCVCKGRAVSVRDTTLGDALAQAEAINRSENILVAQNSFWNWYNSLPVNEREEIGMFENKRRFWIAVRFRHRPQ